LILFAGMMRSVGVRRRAAEEEVEKQETDPVPRLGGIALAASFLGVALLTYLLYPAA